MALKRRNKVEATFSMSSMTDLIFLLLLFFVMASTMSSPNDLKINLPQSRSTHATKQVVAKVSVDSNGAYSVAVGKGKPQEINPDDLEPYLVEKLGADSTSYIALHADQAVEYSKVVKVLDIANHNKIKIVIATSKQ